MSRSWQWNGRRLLVISGLLGLSLATPAGAETTGERALLNQAGPQVVVERKAQAHAVDGAQALLNHAGSSEAPLDWSGETSGRGSAQALSVDGQRALLGVRSAAFHGIAPGR
jgi:hypothetical protein